MNKIIDVLTFAAFGSSVFISVLVINGLVTIRYTIESLPF